MKDSIELLFGSKARWRLLKFFLLNEQKEFTLREITQRNKLNMQEVNTILNQMVKAKFLLLKLKKKSKEYETNSDFTFYHELKNLIVKSNIFPQCESLGKIKSLGDVKLGLISGIFINYPKAKTDLLIVGDNTSRAKMKHLLEDLEAEMGREINYSLMSLVEFKYRANMFDKLITEVLEEPHEIVVNKITNLIQEIKNARKGI
jgi:hypothetical protein